MPDAGKLGLVFNLARFDEVIEADGEGHHLGDAGKSPMGLRFLVAVIANDLLSVASALKVELVSGG